MTPAPEAILSALGESATLDAVKLHWDASMAARTADSLAFLHPDAIRAALTDCGFEPTHAPALVSVANRIASDPALSCLAGHCAWRVYEGPADGFWVSGFPTLATALGDEAGLFYLLLGLAFAPRVREHHRRLAIPEQVTQDTLRQPHCFALNYSRAYGGRLGVFKSQLGWLRLYTREKYFRIGRLEFWYKSYGGGVLAYRHRSTGEVIALAPDQAKFDAQGFIPREQDLPIRPVAWVAALSESTETVTGTPITPRGVGLPQPVTLPLQTWECVLAPGTPVLDVHIPAGGGLTPEACTEAMRRAASFFATQFPDEPPAASFVCNSWIYNPGLEDFLPADSNLVRHLRDVYLYPLPSGGTEGLWFIFLRDPIDPATAPRETSLQRAVLDYLAKGNTWRSSGMFFLTADLAHLGHEHYRATWPPRTLALTPGTYQQSRARRLGGPITELSCWGIGVEPR
jgi:hypothetical protein